MSEAIKKSDIVQGDPFGEIAADITETLAALDKYDKSIKSIANTMQNDLSKAAKKTVQDIEAINKAEVQSEKLMQEKIRTSKMQMDLQAKQNQLNAQAERQAQQQAAALEKEAREKEKANKQAERAAKLAKDEASAYKQLERNTRELKNQSKELGAQMLKLEQSGKRNTAEYRKLESQYRLVTRAAQAGDVQLKKLDKTVGDNFRNVGNYQSAIGGLKSALGSLGIAFGATQVISFLKETTELSRIQEKAVAQVAAGLKSTGGAVGFTLDELKAKASALQKDTLFGDETIMTDLTSVMLTFTNITGKAFDGAQQAALDLSTRMGGDLKGAAVQLGKALNDPIQGVTALRRVGVSFTDSQLEQIKTLQESGDLYAAQTIILNEMNKEFEGSAKAAAAADGGVTQLANAWGDAKEELGKMLLEGLKPTIQALKSFFENLSSDDIRAFVHQLGTIASVIGKVIKAYAVYRAGLVAVNTAQFLFKGGLKDMIASFVRSIPMTRAYRLEQIKLARATTTTGEAVKSTGRALGAVPWMAIIGVVIELATAFYDVASGAAEARKQQELTDKYTANAAKKADKRVSERSDNLQKEISALQRLRNENKISEDEFLKRKEQTIKKTKEQVKEDIKSVNTRKQGYKDELSNAETLQKAMGQGFMNMTPEEKIGYKQIIDAHGSIEDRIRGLRASISASNTKLIEYNKELSDVGETSKDATSEVAAYDSQQARSENQTKTNTKTVKEYKTEFKDLNEYISEQTDLLQKLESIQQERTLTGQQQNIDDMLANQVKAARETGEAQVDQLEATIAAMFDLEKSYIEQKRDFELQQLEADYQRNKAKRLQDLEDEKADLIAAAEGNADAIAKINANFDVKKKQLDTDEALRYEDLQLQKTIVTEGATDQVTELKENEYDEINRVNDAIIEGQKEFTDKVNNVNKEGSDKDVDTIKERYELIQGIQQAATDALQSQIDKRIDLLQQEADAAKSQQDFLQNLAANGNIYAQQSIAEQIRIQREAQQEQLQLERQKQSIELISAGLKTFEASLSEGKTPAEALAATVVNTQVLTGFLKNLQFFEKGTMSAPGGLSVVDEKGAELITDRQGNIKEMGAGKGPRFTMLSPGDKVYTATQTSSLLSAFDNVGNMSKLPKAVSASGGFETATITRELKALQQIVSNKSESNVHWESFSSGIAEIVQHKNAGGRKVTNRFRVK